MRARTVFMILTLCQALTAIGAESARTPAQFLPGGFLGVQLGDEKAELEASGKLLHPSCRENELTVPSSALSIDQVCMYSAPPDSRIDRGNVATMTVFFNKNRVQMVAVLVRISGEGDPLEGEIRQHFISEKLPTPKTIAGKTLFVQGTGEAQEVTASKPKDDAPALLMAIGRRQQNIIITYGFAPLVELGAGDSN